MTSLSLRLLNTVLRLYVKPMFARFENAGAAYQWSKLLGRFAPGTPYASIRYGRDPRLAWIKAGAVSEDRVLLYFHGGGYVACDPQFYLGALANLSRLMGIDVCAVDYRLHHQAPFPAAFEDAVAAWRRLRELGYRPHDIVIAGDSAGGGIAAALLAHLCAKGEPPAGTMLFSPHVNLASSTASMTENAVRDPLLPAARLRFLASLLVAPTQLRDPRISPVFAEFPNVGSCYIQVGSTEILRDDAKHLAEVLRFYGGDVELHIDQNLPHSALLMHSLAPEIDAMLERTARFIQSALDMPSR